MTDPVRLVAFYLPQYHPIPENSAWWGEGFTDWSNVVKGRALFRGHYQPHLPRDLGFYDLRLPETREAQAELARDHGISGFCYYHYWFHGKRLLGGPLDEVVRSGRPDLPFCICWANEPWTRAWDGGPNDILMPQRYSPQDDLEHIRWMLGVMRDPRYIRVDDRPLLLVYRASQLPDPRRTAGIWREEADRAGLGPLLLAHVESFAEEHRHPRDIGFDVAVEFQPDGTRIGWPLRRTRPWRVLRRLRIGDPLWEQNAVYRYAEVVDRMSRRSRPPYPWIRTVTPMWDNTPRRRGGATVLHGSTPPLYQSWLTAAIRDQVRAADAPALVFVNAWNEWAEGNHLEPCERWGRRYLEATTAALDSAVPGATARRDSGRLAHGHVAGEGARSVQPGG